MATRRPSPSSSASIAGCSRSSRVTAHVLAGRPTPPATGDPAPARLGDRGLRVGDLDPPDAVGPERDREPRELPGEAGVARGLRREQRELLPGRRLDPRELELEARDGGRRRHLLQAGEQQALDGLGVGRGLREALLEVEDRRGPAPGEGEVVGDRAAARARRPGPGPAAGRRGSPPAGGGRTGRRRAPRPADRAAGASANRSAVRRGRKRSVSSPRARACSLAPSSPKRATRADRGSSATEPIVRRPKRARRARMSASRVSRRAGYGARNRPSSPGGTRIGGPPSDAWAAATLAAKLVPAIPARGGPGSSGREGVADPGDQRLLDPPQPGQAVDMDGEPPERRVA